MLLKRIHLQNFRNIKFAALGLEGKNQFFLGPNAQGKTNLIEAISLLTALRSFRTQDLKGLVHHGASEAQILCCLEHPKEGEMEILLKFTGNQKELYINGYKVKKFSDFMGTIPIVALSSEDMQFLRGAPCLRRRFLDLTLAAMDFEYFNDLRRYHRLLQERNALLRQPSVAKETIEVYNKLLAPLAFNIYQKRSQQIVLLNDFLINTYNLMVNELEDPEFIYKPDCVINSSEDFLMLLDDGFERDRLLKSTQRGLQRDDFEFKLKSKIARQYASEGQQRGLVVALRLAQVEYFKYYSGVNPIILVDDILGQFDSARSEAFWRIINSESQVIGTGTVLPPENSCRVWEIFHVAGGTFSPCAESMFYV